MRPGGGSVVAAPCRPVALSPCRPVALSPCRPVPQTRVPSGTKREPNVIRFTWLGETRVEVFERGYHGSFGGDQPQFIKIRKVSLSGPICDLDRFRVFGS